MKLNWIPNSLSYGNFFFGFLSIITSSLGSIEETNHFYFVYSTLFILIASVLDVFDGRIARKINQPNPLGKDLDSFADLVTFGLAPAFMFFFMFFGLSPVYDSPVSEYRFAGSIFSFLFPFLASLRLARFNVAEERDFFIGIPSPIAGGSLVLILCFNQIGNIIPIPPNIKNITLPWWLIAITFISYAYLMVSKFIFPKKPASFMNFSKQRSIFGNIRSVIYLVCLVLFFKYFLLLYTISYTIYPIITFNRYKY